MNRDNTPSLVDGIFIFTYTGGMENIRNFVITAHIDHGKSTLADRMLELTGTVEKRKMRAQYLDQLELERERGITIKMAPVRMVYRTDHAEARNSKPEIRNNTENSNLKIQNNLELCASDLEIANSTQEFILNLIDTPGHSDFSYEVSRALAAVEGAVLLVDATKGIQAQTLSNFRAAKKAGLTIVGAVNKVDVPGFDADTVAVSVAELLGCDEKEVYRISAKTGQGVPDLLEAIVEKIPAPPSSSKEETSARQSPLSFSGNQRSNPHQSAVPGRALIFDSLYDDHKGIIAYMRVVDGAFRRAEETHFFATGAICKPKEVGYFSPAHVSSEAVSAGEIGYCATGLKAPELIKIGDTMTQASLVAGHGRKNAFGIKPLPGYKEPQSVVFISFYPDGTSKFEDLKRGLDRLRLTDAALYIEPDANEALGRGLKVGFLGQLHFEIIASRLEREFNLSFLTSFPSIAYRVKEGGVEWIVKEPHAFPVKPDEVWEPMIQLEIVVPSSHLQGVLALQRTFAFEVESMETLRGGVVVAHARMPLAELVRDFDDQLKSVSEGYASFSYESGLERPADVVKLEIMVAGEAVPALTRIVSRKDLDREARSTAEKLKELLPQQQFTQAIQASADGRIVARETIPALRKDVTGYLYGGDRSRKMKLWKKQQRGKEKLKGMAKVHVPVEVFREILKK